MGQYISQLDIESRIDRAKLIQLTDDDKDGIADAKVITDAIADAEGTFEFYARTRYTLPVPVTPKVRSLCLDIVVFKLFERRTTGGEVYEARKKTYDSAIKFLEALSTGKAALDVPAAEETKTNPASADEVLKGGSRPSPFSDDKLRNF